MGILHRNLSPVGTFLIEYLAGSKDVVFGPGSVIQGKNKLYTSKENINVDNKDM